MIETEQAVSNVDSLFFLTTRGKATHSMIIKKLIAKRGKATTANTEECLC
jgi:hypothetical protein